MRTLSLFLVLLSGLGAFTGCAPYWVRTPVVDQKEIIVSLEHKVRKGQVVQQQFHHPADIDQRNLKNLLTQLSYLADSAIYGKPQQTPVFQAAEVEQLVPALAGALAKAGPDQRVRFVSRNRGGGFLFKRDRQTGGVAFVETGDRLNLAFGYVNYEMMSSRPDSFSQEENADPLMIRSSFTPIVAPDFVEHRLTEKGKPFPLWIVADMKQIPEPAAPAVEPVTGKQEPSPAAAATEPKTALGPEKAITAEPAPRQEAPPQPQKVIAKEPAPATTVQPVVPQPASDDSWDARKQENTDKLRYLKELYDSGLIDEKEYKAKKEKLLEQL